MRPGYSPCFQCLFLGGDVEGAAAALVVDARAVQRIITSPEIEWNEAKLIRVALQGRGRGEGRREDEKDKENGVVVVVVIC